MDSSSHCPSVVDCGPVGGSGGSERSSSPKGADDLCFSWNLSHMSMSFYPNFFFIKKKRNFSQNIFFPNFFSNFFWKIFLEIFFQKFFFKIFFLSFFSNFFSKFFFSKFFSQRGPALTSQGLAGASLDLASKLGFELGGTDAEEEEEEEEGGGENPPMWESISHRPLRGCCPNGGGWVA